MSAHPDLSRRAFFAALPAVTAGLAVPAMAAEATGPHWSMLVDTRRCIACQACTMACSMAFSGASLPVHAHGNPDKHGFDVQIKCQIPVIVGTLEYRTVMHGTCAVEQDIERCLASNQCLDG